MKQFVHLLLGSCALLTLAFGCATEQDRADARFDREPNAAERITFETLKVRFNSEDAAKQAELHILPLPDGKKMAFTTRWDDANPRSVRMAELLNKYGFKANCYFNFTHDPVNIGYLNQIVGFNGEGGCHCTEHQVVPDYNPNDVFHVILRNRLQIEAGTDHPAITFALPLCKYRSFCGDPWIPLSLGEVLDRSNIRSSPEYFMSLNDEYGIPADRFYLMHIFLANDRRADMKTFEDGLKNSLEKIKAERGEHPVVTLGMHVWQDEQGWKNLEEILKKYAGNKDWWYCRQSEYIAYRNQYFHTIVSNPRRKGDTVTYDVYRPSAREIGAAYPLSLRFGRGAVEVNGQPIPRNNIFHLEQPVYSPKISLIVNENNSREFFEQGGADDPADNPGVSAALYADLERNRICLAIDNRTDRTLKNPYAVLRLPPRWSDGNVRAILPAIAPHTKYVKEFLPGPVRGEAEFQEGLLYIACEVDFDADRRVCAVTRIDQPHTARPCPRDHALICGPFLLTPEITNALAKVSASPCRTPEALPGVSGWTPTDEKARQEIRMLPVSVPITPANEKWQDFFKGLPPRTKVYGAVLYDFEAPQDGTYQVYGNGRLFLNGSEVINRNNGWSNRRLILKQGRNRVILLHNMNPKVRQLNFSISPDRHIRYRFLPWAAPEQK